jgi:pantoate--beta-alanine ligase
MLIFNDKEAVAAYIKKEREASKTIGFVPTMGALHKGHLSLVKKALQENNTVVVSIFVNPTQFDNTADLEKYPRTLDADVALLKTLSKNIIVFAPNANYIYDGNITSQQFTFNGLEHEMEGKFRDDHFNGVGTIVKRLFEIVQPHNAYFGEKDYQQLLIIKTLVKNYNIPVKITGCPIEREVNGLAMSSRNERLSKSTREEAAFIYKTLLAAKSKFGTKSATYVTKWVTQQFENHSLFKLEYFTIANANTLKTIKRKHKNNQYRAFIAVYTENVRLIDNLALN